MTAAAAGAVAGVGATPWLRSGTADAMPATGLNVIAIVVDDLNDYVGFLGGYGGTIHTPNLDALAAESMTFRQAHVTVPICSASRATLLWGQSPVTHGLTDLGSSLTAPEYQAFSAANPTSHLPAILAANGFATSGGGKVFHYGSEHLSSWTDGFHQTNHELVNGHWGPYNTLFSFGALPPGEVHPDQELVDFCIAKMNTFSSTTPFFLAAGIRLPHLGWVTPQSYIDLYPLTGVVVPPVQTDDWDDLGPIGRAMLEQYQGWLGAGWYEIVENSGTRAEHLQHYLASISHTDAMVGQLMNELASQPYEDDTVVILISDNGYHHGEHMAMRKLTLNNESTRVPLLIRGPAGSGFDPQYIDHPVSSLDFAATVLDAAGVTPPSSIEGRSLRNFDPATAPGHVASWAANSVSFRTERWRWTFHRTATGDAAEMELYDQLNDPGEFTNLLGGHPFP